jgi:hypothetical protein
MPYFSQKDVDDVQAKEWQEAARVAKMARDEKLAAASRTLKVHPSKRGTATVVLRGTSTAWEIWAVSTDGKRRMVWPVQQFPTHEAAKAAANAVWARF